MNDKTKKIVTAIAIVVGVILVCALCYFASVSASEGEKYSDQKSPVTGTMDMTTKAQEESANVAEDEKKDFTDIDVFKYLELFESDEASIVLFSRPTCGYCQIAEPILHHIAYQYDLTLYHVNTDEMDSDDASALAESDDIFNQFGTPLLVAVKDGKVVDRVDGLVDTENYVNFFKTNGFINE